MRKAERAYMDTKAVAVGQELEIMMNCPGWKLVEEYIDLQEKSLVDKMILGTAETARGELFFIRKFRKFLQLRELEANVAANSKYEELLK